MIAGKTSTGFEYEVDLGFTDDWEIVELFKRQYDGDEFAYVELYPRILGAEQFNKLKEHARNAEGRIQTSVINDVMQEIFEAAKSIKK